MKHRRFPLFILLLVLALLPSSVLAEEIVFRGATYSSRSLYAKHSYTLSVPGRRVKWFSNNRSVASIGVMTGRIQISAPGEVTITAKDRKTGEIVGTKSFRCYLRSTRVSVEPSELTLFYRKRKELTSTLTPGNSTDFVKYYSDNNKVASVGLSTGRVTGMSVGETTITVIAADKGRAFSRTSKHNRFATVKVVVTERPEPTPTPMPPPGVFGKFYQIEVSTSALPVYEDEQNSLVFTFCDPFGNPVSPDSLEISAYSSFADVGTGPVSVGVPFEFQAEGGSLLLTPTQHGFLLTAHGCPIHGTLNFTLTVRDPSQPGLEVIRRVQIHLDGKKYREFFILNSNGRWSGFLRQAGQTFPIPSFFPISNPGYTLTGWRFEDMQGNDLGLLTVMPACDVRAIPLWVQNTPKPTAAPTPKPTPSPTPAPTAVPRYALSFDPDAGDDTVYGLPESPLSLAAGEPIADDLPQPNRHGWRFSRWATADGSGVPAVMPAENLTLKAVWQAKTPRTLTLLYLIDGEPETYPIGQTTLFENDFIVLPDLSGVMHNGSPILADYTLRVWTRAAATDLGAQLSQLMPDEDITLLAHLTQEKPEAETFTVTYNTQCALTVVPHQVAPSLPIPRPDPGTREGYRFIGWYLNSACTEPMPEKMGGENLTLYARWIDLNHPSPDEIALLAALGYERFAPVVDFASEAPTDEPTPLPAVEPTEAPVSAVHDAPTESPISSPVQTPEPEAADPNRSAATPDEASS